MKTLRIAMCVVLAAVGARSWAAPQGTFRVDGAVKTKGAWSPARLARAFSKDVRVVRYKDHKGQTHSAHCVPLLDVLNAAGPRLNPRIKNHLIQFTVLVTGHDGYTAALSMGELLADFGNRAAWLALDEDGKPLPTETAPAGLIVPADKKQGRWVHGVASVTVVDGAGASMKEFE